MPIINEKCDSTSTKFMHHFVLQLYCSIIVSVASGLACNYDAFSLIKNFLSSLILSMQFLISYLIFDQDSDDVADDDEDIDRKSRAVLKMLKDGSIPYLIEPGKYKCPWCFRGKMPTDLLGMMQHASYYSSEKRPAHLRAKHAAYGVFLLKYRPQN